MSEDDQGRTPPPNPHYRWLYKWPLPSGGHLEMTLPAPGGNLSPADAKSALAFLKLVEEQLDEVAAKIAVVNPTPGTTCPTHERREGE